MPRTPIAALSIASLCHPRRGLRAGVGPGWVRAVAGVLLTSLLIGCTSAGARQAAPSRQAARVVVPAPAPRPAPRPAPAPAVALHATIEDMPVDPAQGASDAEPKVEPVRADGANRPYRLGGRDYQPLTVDLPVTERGVASWYGRQFHGRRTASGEVFDMHAMTAAHPTWPLPSYALVRNPSNGREVVVRVNDRGPFHRGRIIDLSQLAARKLGLGGVGTVEVRRLTNDEIRTGAWRRPPADAASDQDPRLALRRSEAQMAMVASTDDAADATPPIEAAGVEATREALSAPAASEVLVEAAPSAAGPASAAGRRAGDRGQAVHAVRHALAEGNLPVPPSPQGLQVAQALQTSQAAPAVPVAQAAPPSAQASQAAQVVLMAPVPVPVPVPTPTPTPNASSPLLAAAAAPPSAPTSAAAAVVATPASAASRLASLPGYWVQLGAFRVRDGAEAFRHRLAQDLQWLAPVLTVLSEADLHRLQAGPYASHDQAHGVAQRLREALRLVPVVVERR